MRLAATFLFLFIAGCGDTQFRDANTPIKFLNREIAATKALGREGAPLHDSESSSVGEESAESIPRTAAAQRKIIYTASMEVVVEQFDGVESKLSAWVKKHGGFVASTNLGRMSRKQRSGAWTIRIPVDQYHEFLAAAGDIGVPVSRVENASDVTEEFVDIEARIENKRMLEARILQLLDRPEDKILHVIEVERELARVREEIERMQGRRRYLKDRTSLTTITITIREQREYVPEQAPTFTSRIGNAWNASRLHYQRVFQDSVVFAVRNAIGFIVFMLASLLLLPILWRLWRRAQQIWIATAPELPSE